MKATCHLDTFGPLRVGVARRWRQELDHQLAAVGLSDATWGPLFHLGQAGTPLTQTALADAVGIEGSTLVRLLDSLAARDLVARYNDPADRRVRHIEITPAGRQLLARLRRSLRTPEAAMLEGLSEADMAIAHDALARIHDNLLRMQAQRSAS